MADAFFLNLLNISVGDLSEEFLDFLNFFECFECLDLFFDLHFEEFFDFLRFLFFDFFDLCIFFGLLSVIVFVLNILLEDVLEP